MRHVILDTDIFGDPDDLFALLYCLTLPDIQLELIVTADEYGESRAVHARKLLDLLQLKIPVVGGKDLGNHRLLFVDSPKPQPQNQDFISAICRVVEKYERVTYVCIAPQSNLAAYLRQFPQHASQLDIFIMGATLHLDIGRIEHNIRTDIPAAQFVTRHTHAHWILGDVTHDPALAFSRSHRIYKTVTRSSSPVARLILRSVDQFFDTLYPTSNFHDPLAISSLDAPYVTFSREKVQIAESGQMILATRGSNQHISSQVNYPQFMADFENRILKFFRQLEK
jgi:inosine-uridine nucleoside N-ribohydrolase